jgi:putative flippase GtrA
MHIDIVVSSVIGTLCGGIVNFIMGRKWVFDADNGDVKGQGIRYALVWCGNLLFNTLGVYLMAKVLRVHYLISKVVVSIVVAVTYNYFLQKRFVFRNVA